MTSVKEFELTEGLKKIGVSRFAKEGNTVSIVVIGNHIRFGIYNDDFDKTIRSLDKNLKDYDSETSQYLKSVVSEKWNEITENSNIDANKSRTNSKVINSTEPKIPIDLSFEDWETGLADRYFILKETTNMNLPFLFPSLDFELSVNKILNIKDCTLPFAGIILGPPSSLKTVGIELFRKDKNTFYTDNFTPKSFVSNSTAVKKEELNDIDLLPKIKDKHFLTPELSPTFAKKDDDLVETLGIITRVLDGQGYENDTGAHGHRGYTGEYMFTWIGAAVEIPYKVHRILGALGPKLYFYRIPKTDKADDDYLCQIKNDDFKARLNSIEKALIDFQQWFERCPIASIENDHVKIPWDKNKDDENALSVIIQLAKLLSRLRGVVPTRETYETQGLGYSYYIATIEEPDRAMTQLRNLARGHALTQGRNYVTIEDIPLVIHVVLSTASIERVKTFELLLENGGVLRTSDITKHLNVSAPTAKRTMAEFKALGIVEIPETDFETSEKQMILSSNLNWFLTQDFKIARKGHFQTKFIAPKSLKEISPLSRHIFLNQPHSAYHIAHIM